jgi:membrane associated rhomboid family serine protease
MAVSDSVPGDEGFYAPRRLRSLRIGGALLLLAAFAGHHPLRDLMSWLAGAPAPSGAALFALSGAALLFACGMLALANAMLGLPRLAATDDGIEMDTLFGTKWANWNSLAAFEMNPAHRRALSPRLALAASAITGGAVSANLARKGKIAIPDAFLVPLAHLVEDINARRARALGLAQVFGRAVVSRPVEIAQFGVRGAKVPWLSFLMLAVLASIFAGELRFAIGPIGGGMQPSLATLEALGGVSGHLVFSEGEWYRLFTAPLLHGSFTHILFNGIALLMAGFLLELLVGRVWFFAFFWIGALGGSLMSILVAPASMVSVGASGAIMGLLAAAYVASFRLPAGTKSRWRIQTGAARLLVPALLPLAASGGAHIDYGAHLGGTLSGALAAFLMLREWSDKERLPGLRHIALGAGVVGMVALLAASTAIVAGYPRYQTLTGLIPESDYPKDQAEGEAHAADLVARYPQDPRAHFYRGAALAKARDYEAAEQELRIAVDEADDLHFYFDPHLPNAMRALLVGVLLEEGRDAAAKAAAQPLCAAPPETAPPDSLKQMLVDQHLCAL